MKPVLYEITAWLETSTCLFVEFLSPFMGCRGMHCLRGVPLPQGDVLVVWQHSGARFMEVTSTLMSGPEASLLNITVKKPGLSVAVIFWLISEYLFVLLLHSSLALFWPFFHTSSVPPLHSSCHLSCFFFSQSLFNHPLLTSSFALFLPADLPPPHLPTSSPN